MLYLYPLTGVPGGDLPDGWDAIPGARGCTPESCGFRDHHADLRAAGAAAVFGLSSQDTAYQAELAERLALPFAVLSDPELRLAAALDLPTFTAERAAALQQVTLIVAGGANEHVFYPVFPPDGHAAEVLAWLRGSAPVSVVVATRADLTLDALRRVAGRASRSSSRRRRRADGAGHRALAAYVRRGWPRIPARCSTA